MLNIADKMAKTSNATNSIPDVPRCTDTKKTQQNNRFTNWNLSELLK